MAKRDFYEVLGVPKNADDDTLKKAYRKLAMQFHPDRNPGDKAAEDKFKEAAEAYEILTDKDKRARYDRMGHAGVDGNYGGGGSAGGFNAEDIFSHFGDIFGDAFGGGGQRGGGQRQGGQRGSDLRIKVKMTLEEIQKGANKKIKVRKQVSCNTCAGSGAKDRNSTGTCGTCRGSGYVRQERQTFLGRVQTTVGCPTCNGSGQQITATCASCKGDGFQMGDDTIEIQIPAGVGEGIELTVSGKGNIGKRGAPAGNLRVYIEEEKHQYFEREGNNVVFELYLNFADLALGTAIEVPTLDGRIRLKIPPGTEAGKIFRLPNKGIPALQSYEVGDQLVHVNVFTPKSLTDEDRRIMEKLKGMSSFDPAPNQKSEKGFFDKMRDIFS